MQQGQKLSHDGKQDQALALYRKALDKSPDLYEAHLASGVALDLQGQYGEAQEHFTKAIEVAPAESKAQALRSMAVSYTFEGNASKASEFELQVFNARLAKGDSVGAAEICTELARIYLETGDPDHAYKWYKMGYDTVGRKPDLSDADKNLWLFRWENAQARIAARRGKADEAQQHVAAAKAALDKANNPDQMRFYPYLTGMSPCMRTITRRRSRNCRKPTSVTLSISYCWRRPTRSRVMRLKPRAITEKPWNRTPTILPTLLRGPWRRRSGVAETSRNTVAWSR